MIDVDSVILNLIERSCQAFQRLTGRTNVWLAFQLTNLSIIVYFAWAGVYVLQSGHVVLRIVVAVFCSGVLYALTQTVFKDSIARVSRVSAGRQGLQKSQASSRLAPASLISHALA